MSDNIYAKSFPVLHGDPVTQGHTNYCKAHGHASYTVGGAYTDPFCPRCGERR